LKAHFDLELTGIRKKAQMRGPAGIFRAANTFPFRLAILRPGELLLDRHPVAPRIAFYPISKYAKPWPKQFCSSAPEIFTEADLRKLSLTITPQKKIFLGERFLED
jgi:hypothetical protein